MTKEEGQKAIALIEELECDFATGDTGGYVLNIANWMGYAHERGCLSRNMRIFLVYCSEVHEFLANSPEQRVEEGEEETLRKGCQEFREFRGACIPYQHTTNLDEYPSLWFACR